MVNSTTKFSYLAYVSKYPQPRSVSCPPSWIVVDMHVTSAILDCRYACYVTTRVAQSFYLYTQIIMSSEIYIDYYVK